MHVVCFLGVCTVMTERRGGGAEKPAGTVVRLASGTAHALQHRCCCSWAVLVWFSCTVNLLWFMVMSMLYEQQCDSETQVTRE
jgi:hypothetical protein